MSVLLSVRLVFRYLHEAVRNETNFLVNRNAFNEMANGLSAGSTPAPFGMAA